MPRFKPGTRIKYSDGVIYQVQKDGSYRREDGGKMSKAKTKKRLRDRKPEACAAGSKA
jgi:hypothetical protein